MKSHHALHRRQQPEPRPLSGAGEADQALVGLAHLHFGVDHYAVPPDAKMAERLGRALHQIADAVHVDHGPVGATVVKNAGELGDHGLFLWQEPDAMARG